MLKNIRSSGSSDKIVDFKIYYSGCIVIVENIPVYMYLSWLKVVKCGSVTHFQLIFLKFLQSTCIIKYWCIAGGKPPVAKFY